MLRPGINPEAPSSYSVQRCLRSNEKSAMRNFQAFLCRPVQALLTRIEQLIDFDRFAFICVALTIKTAQTPRIPRA